MPLSEQMEKWLAPGRFVTDSSLTSSAEVERIRWEIYQGRLLQDSLTRQERVFESRYVLEQEKPIISLKHDVERGELHVVRYVESYIRQGYDSGGGVFLTQERMGLVAELIATFETSRTDLAAEMVAAISRAVTGTPLPLTPSEAPLPAYSFGRLWYRGDEDESGRELEHDIRSRSTEQVSAKWAGMPKLFATLRRMFLEVSLSPYTDFVDRVLAFLARLDPIAVVKFEAWLLRLVSRHLTAYDLVLFHHRGANYPDALLLDAVLSDYMARLETLEDDFDVACRVALRQAYLVRRRYEDHAVPDVPTSPGEHARVYPDSYPRVPEEQILQAIKRRKRLFVADPLRGRLTPKLRDALVLSLAVHPEELGAALYLDRPFGAAKGPVAADATPHLTSLAYSRSIATQRLRLLEADLELPAGEAPPSFQGVPLAAIGGPVRQGTVSLTDAARCSGDFVFRKTLSGSVRGLLSHFEFGTLTDQFQGRVLLARSAIGPGVVVYDDQWRQKLEFEPILENGYINRRGVEIPAGGLRVTSIEGGLVVPPSRTQR